MLVRTALALAGLTLVLVASRGDVALAAKPDRYSSSSIVLVLLNAPGTTAATEPRYGDQVTFSVSTQATAYPYVNLKCYQDGALVGEGWAGFFYGALGDQVFTLWSPQWIGGAADCTAWLTMYANGKWRQLASTSFHVDP
jgi:hypothetical protein